MNVFGIIALAAWALGWAVNLWLSRQPVSQTRPGKVLIAAVFGLTVLAVWEALVPALNIPTVTLPPPSLIGATIANSLPVLWGDFVQTVLKGALSGYVIGASAALLVAVAVDRYPFLQRGLLPIGNFVSALPIVGLAPIMVNWFGFGWESKAAVVTVMVFFPVLVNAVAGLAATDPMQRDLMATWGAPYRPALFKLRLPAAMPFIFNGLKIATTLSLIGAIVAEFFGSPTQGIGFRISTAVGSLAIPMVWAQIAVAALSGTVFYGLVAWAEARVTFWHPSIRGRT